MKPDDKARELGIDVTNYEPIPNLAGAIRVGNTLYTSGHISTGYKGKLGKDFTTEQGQVAARICVIQLLQAIYAVTGTLNSIRCVRLLGAVNSTPDFVEQHLVMNGASQVLWDIFGKEGRGFHARSALGFVSVPNGFAVEIEGIFEVVAEE
jgi:enamine deaminase RidA (YjgF/YER057c/UK114 family)